MRPGTAGHRPAPRVEELLAAGPWTHRQVHTRGQRLHVADCGDPSDPLILLLHGATGGWFDWRAQLPALAAAGQHAVAASLRGWGTSDRTPSGYRADVAADDMAGLIRALGHDRALVVGHGLGGVLAWTMAARHPGLLRGVAVLAAPHPLLWSGTRLLAAAPRHRFARRALRLARILALPGPGPRGAAADPAAAALALAGPAFRSSPGFAEALRLHRASLALGARRPAARHIAWLVGLRAGGRRAWAHRLQEAGHVARSIGGVPPIRILGGAVDPVAPPALIRAAARLAVSADDGGVVHEPAILAGVGHFPQLEAPAEVTAELLAFAAECGRRPR